MSRRSLLGAAVGALAATAACSTSADEAATSGSSPPAPPAPEATPPSPPPASGPSPEPEPSPTTAGLDAFPPYEPLPTEVEPPLKAAGAAFLSAALTTDPAADGTGEAPAEGIAGRVAGVGQPPGPAAALVPLLAGTAASALRIVYPQSGGLADDRLTARLMIVAEQHLLPRSDPTATERRSLTVRLSFTRPSADTSWQVTETVLPDPITTRPVSTTSAAVQALLGNPRVVLPEAARLDALSPEGIDDRIAETLNALSEDWVVDVSVLRSGHSVNVFGTDRTSNHAVGRGVDIWALDGIPIIEKSRSPWRPAMELAAAMGASEVGGPEEIAPEPYFTNASHQDHIHVGFGP